MGIPKFYRWLSERYPLINQPGGATVVPIIDNFYLDMNGIIHNCTHGNNPDVRLTEEEMIVKIFTYLDKLFHIVRPQKLIFMAIDGVAPRAKMNQQRARRFKAAKEAEEAAEAAARRGDPVPDASTRFDSNCITPGTPFMARLGAHLRFFIRKKIAEDPAWQKPTVVFSGHDVPGEGEHKIMEYIRWAKKSPGYAPNTRHCLYGLDADLIMLSLVTHEPHFNLLREVVSYGGGNRGQPAREVLENPCQEHFVLLQVGLLRDYFDLEFRPIADSLPFAYDLERIIDDFVLFCMLVGNDFLPPLPTVDINEGSLDAMMELYRKMLPELGGYVTFAGDLHRARLEKLLTALAENEADVLEARATDAEEYEAKQDRRRNGRAGGSALEEPAWASSSELGNTAAATTETIDELDADTAFALEMARLALQKEGHELELMAVEEGDLDPAAILGNGTEDATSTTATKPQEGPTMMSKEARALFAGGDKVAGLSAWRRRYYSEKLGIKHEEHRRDVVESYLQGLHWVLEYYYRGVASWNWFYPHHYAPMASDCIDLASIEVSFSQGKPFLPYEQLLAVQPSSSYRLLPDVYRWIMTDPQSPIADFYPTEFAIDLEGKRADWEGVVLIPFIDEQRLLQAARSIPPSSLTPEERARNTLGDMIVFSHDESSNELTFCTSTLPAHYTSVTKPYSTAAVQAAPPPLPAGEKGFTPTTVVGTKVGAGGPPGFPTLRTLGLVGALRRAGCNVFGMASKKESLVLTIKGLEEHLGGATLDAARVASAVVGHRTWVKWPYLQEAQVEAVTDGRIRATAGGVTRQLTAAEVDDWHREGTKISNELMTKQGLDLGMVTLLLHVRPCEGLVRQLDGTVEKRFSKQEVIYPLQVTLRRNPSPDPRFQPNAAAAAGAGANALPAGAKAMFLGRAHYGCVGEILPSRASVASKATTAALKIASKGGDGDGDGAAATKEGADSKLPPAAGPPYRLQLLPAPANAAQAAQAARRILTGVTVQYLPSGQVARRLAVSPRTLGRITGNVWIRTGSERHEKVDVGLCIKNAGKGLFVPDYCTPLEPRTSSSYGNNANGANGGQQQSMSKGGWAYSDAMIRIFQQYKQRFPHIWSALEQTDEFELELENVLPGVDHDQAVEQIASIRTWLKTTPLSRKPLVKTTSKVAPESAVRMLQAALPPRPKTSPSVEMENVGAALLLPPLDRGGIAAAFAGGTFELADRVAAAGSSGTPPFGLRGTVVAIYDEDTIEVLFDEEFLGGTDLHGRCTGNCGLLVPASELLNLSRPHAVRAEGDAAPKAVKSGGGTRVSGVSALALASGALGQLKDLQLPSLSAADVAATRGSAISTKAVTATATASTTKIVTAGVSYASVSSVPPKIPGESGNKGFGMGRGRGNPVPAAVPAPPAPGSQPASTNGGAQLLAQLKKQSAAASAAPQAPGSVLLSQLKAAGGGQASQAPAPAQGGGGGGPQSPNAAAAAAATASQQQPPTNQQMHPMHPMAHMAIHPPHPPHMMMPPPPPGMMMPMMMRPGMPPYPYPPHPNMMLPHPGMPYMMPPGAYPHPMHYGPPPPPVGGTGSGGGSAPQPNPGSALLSQLKGGSGSAAASPQTAGTGVASASPPQSGALLLQQLQKGGGGSAAAAAAPPPPSKQVEDVSEAAAADEAVAGRETEKTGAVAGGDLSDLWHKLQGNNEAAAGDAVPPPPVPSAAMLGGDGDDKDEADAFWDLLSQPKGQGSKQAPSGKNTKRR